MGKKLSDFIKKENIVFLDTNDMEETVEILVENAYNSGIIKEKKISELQELIKEEKKLDEKLKHLEKERIHITNEYKVKTLNELILTLDKNQEQEDFINLTNVVFLKVHQKLSTFTDYSSFGGWLRIIANRTAIDYLRKVKEKSMELGEDTGRLPVELTNSSEEEDLVNLLEYESLLKEFEKLPKKTQKIFNLFYVEDLTVDEISKVLKIPTGTIKAALSRTRRKIKNNLKV